MMLRRKITTIALSLTLVSASVYGSNLDQHQVESPGYGEALYLFFQQKNLDAINRILVNEYRGDTVQRGYSRLLLADLYYRYGLYSDSQQLFANLLEQTEATPLLNRIWFNLAKLSYDNQDFAATKELLLRIKGVLPPRFESERQAILSNLTLQEGQFNPALKHSRQITGASDWRRFTLYNIAVQMLEQDQFNRGQNLMEEVIASKVSSNTQAALRDRAYLSLAIKQIRAEEYEAAEENLSQIRLNGPSSSKAILATGWLHEKQDQLDRAIGSWSYLLEQNRLNAETREAILAIPMSLEEAGKEKQALQSFRRANYQLEQQQAILASARRAVLNDQLLELVNAQLYEDEERPDGSSTLFDRTSNQSAELAELFYVLLASSEFQKEMDSLRELYEIRGNLARWQTDLPTLSVMLEERRTRFALRIPLLQEQLDDELSGNLLAQIDQLETEINRIEATEDHMALLNEVEQENLERIQKVDEKITDIADREDMDYPRDMIRLFRGLLEWQVANAYPARVWQVKKQLAEMKSLAEINQQRRLSLSQMRELSEKRFNDFEGRIAGKQAIVDGLLAENNRLIGQQIKKLNRAAIDELDRQQGFLLELKINTSYAVARLNEKLAKEAAGDS